MLLLFVQILQLNPTESSGDQSIVVTTTPDPWRRPAHRLPIITTPSLENSYKHVIPDINKFSVFCFGHLMGEHTVALFAI